MESTMDGMNKGARVAVAESPDWQARMGHWRMFRIVFALTYLGIMLDIATTSLGYDIAGSRYEQNPIGSVLIEHLGWAGMFGFLTLLCLICYRSMRVVYLYLPTWWTRIIYPAMILISALRWLTVVTSVLFLLHPAPGA